MKIETYSKIQEFLPLLEIDGSRPYRLAKNKWWNSPGTVEGFVGGSSKNWHIGFWCLPHDDDTVSRAFRILVSNPNYKIIFNPVTNYFWSWGEKGYNQWTSPSLVSLRQLSKESAFKFLPEYIQTAINETHSYAYVGS